MSRNSSTPSVLTPKMRIVFLLGGLLLAGLGCVLHFGFSFDFEFLFPKCSFRKNTGLFCVGCGGTRAFGLLLQGRIVESLRHNCFCPVVLGALSYVILELLVRGTKYAIPPLRIAPRTGMYIIIALALFMILRNIPVVPLIFLAPPR